MGGQIFDNQTVNSGGGTVTSSEIEVGSDDVLQLQTTGDSNSTDLNVVILQKVNSQASNPGEYDSLSNIDLTSKQNNSNVNVYDVKGASVIQIFLKNNAGSNTDISQYYSTL